jgi:serine protease Do
MTTLEIRRSRRSQILAALLGTTLLAGGAVIGFSAAGAANTPPPISLPHIVKQEGFADLVAAVKPSVVNISTTELVKQQQLSQLDENSEMGQMLKQFLGPDADKLMQQQQQQSRPEHALGSGFVIDPAGYIVTNNHVIDDATEIEVTTTDGTMYPAKVVGRDTKTDIALLKIDAPRPLPYVAFGNSDKERIGDWVIAVGNPYGLGGSVSAGIVSGSKRDINSGPFDDYLQVDAPINPGNSGGPLFDQAGQVIGIDTAIYSPSGGSVGIGFAIPSNVASRVVEQLRAHGHVARGWLGVQMQTVTPALAKAARLPKVEGVLVDVVIKDSPASRAGIAQGDVITAFKGSPVDDPRDLAFAVADTASGQSVPLQVWRDGHFVTLAATIGTEQPEKTASAQQAPAGEGQLGLALAPLPDDQKQQLGVAGGALVQDVKPGSPADESGIEPGDVILRIGSRQVTSPGEAAAQIHAAEEAKRSDLALLILRDGNTAYVPLELGNG